MFVLGISALYHDSAAAIICDGEIIAAAQEERFTRKKCDLRVPVNAINFCLKQCGISMKEVDYVIYYDDPILTLDRFLQNAMALGAGARTMVERTTDNLFGDKLWIHNTIRKEYGQIGKNDKLMVSEHHLSHAASAFYPSPFEEAAFITIDGVGEWSTTTYGIGSFNKIKIIKEIDYPNSLGLLYSAFTYFCGFKVNFGDYKLMGLAPYGEPIYVDVIKEKLIKIYNDGSYRLNLEYFDFYRNDVMTNDKFEVLFGGPRRMPESPITKREMDMAASIQVVLEEILLLMVRHVYKETGMKNLVLAGGVALNCVANGKILKEKIFDNIWIQPAAGDAGGALGAALYAYYKLSENDRVVEERDSQKGSYLGPEYSNDEIKEYLDKNKYVYKYYSDDNERNRVIAELLADGLVVGVCDGRMEYGPRALGNRSILGDARSEKMQSVMNLKIKYRESFRPFAPAVLEEDATEYFDLTSESPYMLICADVQDKRKKPFNIKEYYKGSSSIDLLPIVNVPRSDIPAVTHVDYSARVQTVSKERAPRFYGILSEFKKITKSSVLINTSFNVRGEPIVCSPEDSYRCFMRTEMDALVLGNMILLKKDQPSFDDTDWRKDYELD
jgi:carbamoyltransferase